MWLRIWNFIDKFNDPTVFLWFIWRRTYAKYEFKPSIVVFWTESRLYLVLLTLCCSDRIFVVCGRSTFRIRTMFFIRSLWSPAACFKLTYEAAHIERIIEYRRPTNTTLIDDDGSILWRPVPECQHQRQQFASKSMPSHVLHFCPAHAPARRTRFGETRVTRVSGRPPRPMQLQRQSCARGQ